MAEGLRAVLIPPGQQQILHPQLGTLLLILPPGGVAQLGALLPISLLSLRSCVCTGGSFTWSLSASTTARAPINQSVCLLVCLLLLTLFCHYVFSKIEEVRLGPLSHRLLLIPVYSSINVLLFVFILIFLSPFVVLCSSQSKVFELTGDENNL